MHLRHGALMNLSGYWSARAKKQLVLPIFYKVEPSDVRKHTHSYEKAMIVHENRFGKDSEKVKAWRSALSGVCDIKGEHCRNDVSESKLIKKIVKATSAKLPPVPLQIKRLVGLDSRFEQVKSLIDIESNDAVCMLGIYGAGGIGKTTFAVDLYNKLRHQFEAASFLGNIREKSSKSINGLEDLQKILLSEMGDETQTMLGSTFKGGSEIKRRLGHKRVLLVLDDVDNIKQLESLAGGLDWFGSGSMIIITTRDTNVLKKHDVEIKKYKMEELDYRDSLELFCWYAFNMSGPAENFEDISSRAVRFAKGIPLALRIIGSNLKGRTVKEWETELDKYRKVPNAEIQGVLEISYNSLSELDQKLFLDIACFFKGERWVYVKRILEACDFYPIIRVFVNKCLITLDEYGCLEMHDVIQDMGREIFRRELPSNIGDRNILWSHKEILEVLIRNLGSRKIEGIMLDPPQQKEVKDWTNSASEKVKNLRIPIVQNTKFLAGQMMLNVRMVQRVVAGLTSKVMLSQKPHPQRPKQSTERSDDSEVDDSCCLRWRLLVTANNVCPWRTVPLRCYEHVVEYITGGHYEQDLELMREQILGYASEIALAGDGMDAWILDVDDACISNIRYYEAKRFGCDPFAIPVVLGLFHALRDRGFKLFLLTSRDEATLGKITTLNLRNQGFIGYECLILRAGQYKGQSTVRYKSAIRKQIKEQGYRIWGNVGDQWSDVQGECLGNRTFKLPNPMYFVS